MYLKELHSTFTICKYSSYIKLNLRGNDLFKDDKNN